MNKLTEKKTAYLKLPNDIPKDFFDIVSKVLNFVEDVDQVKNK